jgi:hypothetical protein
MARAPVPVMSLRELFVWGSALRRHPVDRRTPQIGSSCGRGDPANGMFAGMRTLRTPDERFHELVEFPYRPEHCEVAGVVVRFLAAMDA